MNTLNLSIDIPTEFAGVDLSELRKELTDIAKVLLMHRIFKPKKEEIDDPFAELDKSWGGDRDANEIAEELHDSRVNSREAIVW